MFIECQQSAQGSPLKGWRTSVSLSRRQNRPCKNVSVHMGPHHAWTWCQQLHPTGICGVVCGRRSANVVSWWPFVVLMCVHKTSTSRTLSVRTTCMSTYWPRTSTSSSRWLHLPSLHVTWVVAHNLLCIAQTCRFLSIVQTTYNWILLKCVVPQMPVNRDVSLPDRIVLSRSPLRALRFDVMR